MSATSIGISVEKKPKSYLAILPGGLIAGICDLTYAIAFYGLLREVGPIRVMQSVASGLLGADAYQGGQQTAILGVFLHFFIAFTAATVYYAASRKLKFLTQHAVIWGALYGIGIYFFMNLVVLPLSAYPHPIVFRAVSLIPSLIVHMFFVGLPISLAVRHYSIKRSNE